MATNTRVDTSLRPSSAVHSHQEAITAPVALSKMAPRRNRNPLRTDSHFENGEVLKRLLVTTLTAKIQRRPHQKKTNHNHSTNRNMGKRKEALASPKGKKKKNAPKGSRQKETPVTMSRDRHTDEKQTDGRQTKGNGTRASSLSRESASQQDDGSLRSLSPASQVLVTSKGGTPQGNDIQAESLRNLLLPGFGSFNNTLQGPSMNNYTGLLAPHGYFPVHRQSRMLMPPLVPPTQQGYLMTSPYHYPAAPGERNAYAIDLTGPSQRPQSIVAISDASCERSFLTPRVSAALGCDEELLPPSYVRPYMTRAGLVTPFKFVANIYLHSEYLRIPTIRINIFLLSEDWPDAEMILGQRLMALIMRQSQSLTSSQAIMQQPQMQPQVPLMN